MQDDKEIQLAQKDDHVCILGLSPLTWSSNTVIQGTKTIIENGVILNLKKKQQQKKPYY